MRGANWVGDAVMTIPALRELRRLFPDAHITLATRAWAQGIFADADFLDDLLMIDGQSKGRPGFLRQRRDWRHQSFDLAVLLPNAFQPAFLAAAARVPLRVGYATDARRWLLTHPLKVPTWRGQRHEVFYYLNIIAELERTWQGISHVDFAAPQFGLRVSHPRQEVARLFLQERGLTLTRPLVALCPGSTNSRAKRWPAERFAMLADQLVDEAGADCLLIGAQEELAVTEAVVARMRHQPVVLTGQTTLAETVAVLRLADLLITNDTGPAHIAGALDLPTLVIFGPTDPVTTRPFSPLAEVIRQPPDCAPCMLRDCPIDHRCMTAITPAGVFRRAASILMARQAWIADRHHVEVAG